MDIGINDNSRKAVAEGLKAFLAETYALYLKTQNFHWNVTGPMFKAVHELTEEQYTELAAAVDEIAERIRALGFKVPGGFGLYNELATISDGDPDLAAQAMVAALAADHETLIRKARALSDIADDADDSVTEALIDDRLTVHEKTAWMLRSLAA